MDIKTRILALGEEKFFRDGFYKTTMDDLAIELRMSKKTIYKLFASKEDLVHSIALHFLEKMRANILPEINSEKNAIEKLAALLRALARVSERITPQMLDEMRRHLPSLWEEVDKFRVQMMFGNITKVIDQGKNEGLFLNYSTPLIMNILVASVRSVVNPEFIYHNNISIGEAARYAIKIVIGGILTEKGKELFINTFSETES